jgi:uncharacterized membrane protein YedE/YeeE
MSNPSFTPLSALAGGVLIGLGASVYLLVNGRVAGVSGLIGGIFAPVRNGARVGEIFLAALLATGALAAWLAPEMLGTSRATLPSLALAVGTRASGGCTSGHGVCGISRGSARSIVATATFVATGVATVVLVHALRGGSR